MIATVDIDINAANPGMPLKEFAAFTSSPSHLRLRNVPRRIGLWELTKIYVSVTFPDNATRTVEATHNGALWTATVAGCAASGTVRGGFQVIADGVDESGNAITGYVLGVGDVRILSRDSTVNVDGITYPLKICEEMPADPKIGWCFTINGILSWYNGTEWIPLGGGSGDMSHADFAELSNVPDLEPDDVGFPEICQVMNKVKNLLKPAVALFALALPFLTIAAEVKVNKLSNLKGASNVVTRVDLNGLVSSNAVRDMICDATNGIPTKAQLDAGWWSEWTVLREGVDVTSQLRQPVWIPDIDDYGDEIWDVYALPSDGEHGAGVIDSGVGRDATALHWGSESGAHYTATRHRVAAPVPTKPSDIGAASPADATLTPSAYSEWTFSSQPSGEGHFYFLDWQAVNNGTWLLCDSDGVDSMDIDFTNGPKNATSVSFSNVGVTATRSVVGYTLGSQTNKVLASTNFVGVASGGIEDPVRHCTWVQCVTNGVFYWIVQEVP